MEDLCWNCGSVTHHRKDCTEPKNMSLRKEIQNAFKKGTGARRIKERNKVQLLKLKDRLDNARTMILPPLSYFSKEVDRIDQCLYDLLCEQKNLPVPIASVSADCLEERLCQVSTMQSLLDSELKMIRTVGALQKAYQLDDMDILVTKIASIKDNQATLSNSLHAAYVSLKDATSVMKDINNNLSVLNDYILKGIEAYSGRPLNIAALKMEWSKNKTLITSCQMLINKYIYLFTIEDGAYLRNELARIKENWKLLKEMKRDYEKEISNVQCKICYEVEVTYAIIPCGHTYCNNCIQTLDECANCRGIIANKLKLHF